MNCIDCPLLKKAKAEITALQRDQDAALLFVKLVIAVATDCHKQLLQQTGEDIAQQETCHLDMLLEKLRNRSIEAMKKLDKELEKIMLNET